MFYLYHLCAGKNALRHTEITFFVRHQTNINLVIDKSIELAFQMQFNTYIINNALENK